MKPEIGKLYKPNCRYFVCPKPVVPVGEFRKFPVLDFDDIVMVVDVTNNWYKILGTGCMGWVYVLYNHSWKEIKEEEESINV